MLKKNSICVTWIVVVLLFVLAFAFYWDYGNNYPASYTQRVQMTRLRLMALRGWVNDYYQQNNYFPDTVELEKNITDKNQSITFKEYISKDDGANIVSTELNSQGGWYYDKTTGQVKVNLTEAVGSYFRPWFYKDGDQIPSDW